MVFAERVAKSVNNRIQQKSIQKSFPDWNADGTNEPKEMVLITQSRKELKEIMTNYVGIVRSDVPTACFR